MKDKGRVKNTSIDNNFILKIYIYICIYVFLYSNHNLKLMVTYFYINKIIVVKYVNIHNK